MKGYLPGSPKLDQKDSWVSSRWFWNCTPPWPTWHCFTHIGERWDLYFWTPRVITQRSLQNVLIFRLLLKLTVERLRECVFSYFLSPYGAHEFLSRHFINHTCHKKCFVQHLCLVHTLELIKISNQCVIFVREKWCVQNATNEICAKIVYEQVFRPLKLVFFFFGGILEFLEWYLKLASFSLWFYANCN